MILITGGAGYIGTHTCSALHASSKPFLIIDDFSNSSPLILERLSQLCGYDVDYIEGNIKDAYLLNDIFQKYPITGVIHFAGSKYVGESVAKPIQYYHNNLTGLLTLLESMIMAGVKNLVFSSSASVYGEPQEVPLTEEALVHPINPYGRSKLMSEQILKDVALAHPDMRIACLRYFNPIGAHESALIGEVSRGIPNNLLPYILKVASKELAILKVFGDDYPTPDGTPLRDYIHVMDLAEAHVAALEYLEKAAQAIQIINLGTGRGISVLEIIRTFEKVNKVKIPYEIDQRRPGDAAQYWADPSKAEKVLHWKAKRSLDKMLIDSWSWHTKNSICLHFK